MSQQSPQNISFKYVGELQQLFFCVEANPYSGILVDYGVQSNAPANQLSSAIDLIFRYFLSKKNKKCSESQLVYI